MNAMFTITSPLGNSRVAFKGITHDIIKWLEKYVGEDYLDKITTKESTDTKGVVVVNEGDARYEYTLIFKKLNPKANYAFWVPLENHTDAKQIL